MKIAIITPARNERENLDRIFKSLLNQKTRPSIWVIVDDNSRDGTFDRAVEFTKYSWVKASKAEFSSRDIVDRSFKAFEFGVSSLPGSYELIMKLDADTLMPASYLGEMLRRFEEDVTLGIASGVNLSEWTMLHHVRGNNRVYRRRCWNQLRLPSSGIGWDTLDVIEARLGGWQARVFRELACRHLRSREQDAKYTMKLGKISRHLGYYQWYAMARASQISLTQGPVQAISFIAGYLSDEYGSAGQEIREIIRADQLMRMRRLLRIKT